jgi:hypothetical protein
MALSDPVTIFGIHQLTAYNIDTGIPYGTAKVIGNAELSSEAELVQLNGGSSKYPWKVERGVISAELSLTLREYPPFLFEVLLGKAMTENSAETSGSVSAIADVNGTSCVNASTGIASVAVINKGNVKFGTYVVKVVTSTTVDVYAYTDVDFAQGTNTTYENDLLKITASPLTITQSGDVTIPNYGIKLTGGSGTIGMTPGDTARFTARPINTVSHEVVIGSSSEVFTDFGLLIAAQRPGDNYMIYVDCYKVAGAGLPIAMNESAFSEASVTLQLYRDTSRNGVYRLERVKATT